MKKVISRVLGAPEEMKEWTRYYDPNAIFKQICARLDEEP